VQDRIQDMARYEKEMPKRCKIIKQSAIAIHRRGLKIKNPLGRAG